MSENQLNVDFKFNTEETKKQTSEIRKDVKSVNEAATEGNKPLKEREGILERLRSRMTEIKAEASKATSFVAIEKANAQIQLFEKEIDRLRKVGRQGFDDMGKAIPDFSIPTGKIERLTYATNLYKKAINEATNTDIITKYNEKLEQTQNEITRLRNVGKAGFDELGNKIVRVEKDTSTFVGKLSAGVERLRRLTYILPGIGLTGFLALAWNPLMKYIKGLDLFSKKLSDAEGAQKDLSKEMTSAGSAAAKATLEVEGMKQKFEQARSGVITKASALKAYNEGIGKTLGFTKDLNEAEERTIKNGDAYIELMFKKARAAAIMELYTEQMSKAAKEMAKTSDEAGSYILSGTKDAGLKNIKGEDIYEADAERNRKKAAKPFEDRAEAFKKLWLSSNEDIAGFVKKNNLVLNGDSGEGMERAFSSFEAMQQKIYDLKAKYARKVLSQDEEELQAIRDEFVKITKEVERFNKNPKNKIKVTAEELDQVRDQAIADLTYKQETEKLKISLSEQKKLHQDYEEYKISLGKEKADEKYRDLIDVEKSHLENLRAELEKIPADGSGSQSARKEELEKQIREEESLQLKKFNDLLKANQSYQAKVKLAIETFEAEKKRLIEAGNFEEVEVLTDLHKQNLNSLADSNAKQLESYKKLFEGVENISKKQAEVVLANAKKMFEQLKADGLISEELYKQILNRIRETEKAIGDRLSEKIIQLSYAFSDIQQSVTSINQSFGEMIGMASKALQTYSNVLRLSDAYKNAKNDQDKFAAGLELVSTAVSGIVDVFGTITSASKARKEAEEAYYNAVIQGQKEYNLSLIEGIRLRHELNENVFVKDYKERALDSSKALVKANEDYLQSLKDLEKGKAKVGQRNALDWNAIGKTTGSGAGAGAAIGTMILPGVGTIIGGAIGTVVGFIGGLFGGKKKKDTYGGLLSEYPELIKKNKDGIEEFNTALAETLIANNLVDESTKALLKNTIDLNNERVKAIEQLRSVISDLAGSLGNDLQNALVNAFKAGEDAGDAFGESVSKVIENITAQMLFAELFKKDFDKLQKEMEESYGIGGDQSFVDDLIRFYENAGKKVGSFNEALEAASKLSEQYGLGVFAKDEKNKAKNRAGTIAGITEVTGGRVESELGGVRLAQLVANEQQKKSMENDAIRFLRSIALFMKIEEHTSKTATNTNRLENIEKALVSMDKKMVNTDALMRGAGL